MPTLVLWGDADRLIPVEQCDEWACLIANAKKSILRGVGHLLFDEDPDAVAAVRRFTGEPVIYQGE